MNKSNSASVSRIVIVGGGSAGWMCAAALSTLLNGRKIHISLVESEAIGTVGVGEATLPHLRYFNQRLGILEPEFMRATQATFKLGIEFGNWGQIGDRYIHPFGEFGESFGGIGFHHFWLRARAAGETHALGDYSLPVRAAQMQRFDYPHTDAHSLESSYSYAYHVDSSLYARFLRQRCVQRGVLRVEGKVQQVLQNPESGFIQAVQMESGERIAGDLFVDCSGFRGLLIEQCLGAGYENWNGYLPCDRAIAIPCQGQSAPLPYTQATAESAGWRWRIPLQHRIGNGHVYSSSFMSDAQALKLLQENLEGPPQADPNFLRFNTGRRRSMWLKNCVAIGLSAGFLEPLESTGLHLIQLGIMKLVEHFPDHAMEPNYAKEFNRVMQMEIERIKDFLILHYHATQRRDSEFWRYCQSMKIPEGLAHAMSVFEQSARVVKYQEGLFLEPSWIAVFLGQGRFPQHIDPRVQMLSEQALGTKLSQMRDQVSRCASAMTTHQQALDRLSDPNNRAWQPASMHLYNSRASH